MIYQASVMRTRTWIHRGQQGVERKVGNLVTYKFQPISTKFDCSLIVSDYVQNVQRDKQKDTIYSFFTR